MNAKTLIEASRLWEAVGASVPDTAKRAVALLNQALGSYIANPKRRSQDRADVDQLIIRTSLPRDLAGIDASVVARYREI